MKQELIKLKNEAKEERDLSFSNSFFHSKALREEDIKLSVIKTKLQERTD